MPLRLVILTIIGAATLTTATWAEDSPNIPPKTVTLNLPSARPTVAASEIAQQAGFAVEWPDGLEAERTSYKFEKLPAWSALQELTDATKTRIVLRDHGRKIALAKRDGPPAPSSVDGPFRVAIRQVRAVNDFDSGRTFTELTLEVHWEPRVTVFRLEGQPTIAKVEDDRGSKITADTSRTKAPVSGAIYSTSFKLSGVPRSASKLKSVSGSITVTATDRFLLFPFGRLTAAPIQVEKDTVKATVTKVEKVENRVEVHVSLEYPPNTPAFDSFESFITENKARLTQPNAVWESAEEEVSGNGRLVSAVYRFTESADRKWDPNSWTFEYASPAPLREYPVRFELKDVMLP